MVDIQADHHNQVDHRTVPVDRPAGAVEGSSRPALLGRLLDDTGLSNVFTRGDFNAPGGG